MPNKMSYIGDSYGRLTVVAESISEVRKDGRFTRRFLCSCICGNAVTAPVTSLLSGGTQSCGCLRKETARRSAQLLQTHGQSGKAATSLYKSWSGAKNRCFNPTNKDYHNYGARGIQVCPEWKDSFVAFATWITAHLGDRPEGFSLDRINNDGNYAPGNVRWASATVQTRNQRSRSSLSRFLHRTRDAYA